MTRGRAATGCVFIIVGLAVAIMPARAQRQGVGPGHESPNSMVADAVSTTKLVAESESDEVWPDFQLHTLKDGRKFMLGRREQHFQPVLGAYHEDHHKDAVLVDTRIGTYRIFHISSPADNQRVIAFLEAKFGISEDAATRLLTEQPQPTHSRSDYSFSTARRKAPRRLSRLFDFGPKLRPASAIMQAGTDYGYECTGSAMASGVTTDIVGELGIANLQLGSTASLADAEIGEECDYDSGYCTDGGTATGTYRSLQRVSRHSRRPGTLTGTRRGGTTPSTTGNRTQT